MTDLVDNARLRTSHEHAVVSFLKPLHLSLQLYNTETASLLTTSARNYYYTMSQKKTPNCRP